MRVLVTGGFGYLGGRLAKYLATEAGYELLLGSRQQVGAPKWLPHASVVHTQWDSPTGLEQICTGVDAVVHLAGMNAQDCIADPVAALQVNAVATARLLQAAVRVGVNRFIYVSTAHVYGSPLTGVITEMNCPLSLHPYAASHRAGEDTVRAAHQRGDILGIVIRLSNAYGAPAHKGANCWMLLINDLCRQAVTTRRMVLRSSGMQRRDFITLTDACRAIRCLLGLPHDNVDNGLFNVGGGWAPTILEMTERVAERIYAVAGYRPDISRLENYDTECAQLLDYRMKKVIGKNINMPHSGNVDKEIDGLIQFCLGHLTEL